MAQRLKAEVERQGFICGLPGSQMNGIKRDFDSQYSSCAYCRSVRSEVCEVVDLRDHPAGCVIIQTRLGLGQHL